MPFGYCTTNLMQNTKYLTFEDQRVIQILWKLSTITCTLLKTIGNLSSKEDSCVMESATAKHRRHWDTANNVIETFYCYCFKSPYYRPQTKFAKVMFLQVSVCPQGGACVVAPGGGACVVAPRGVCMVAPGGGHAWLLWGGAWLLQGGHAWLLPGGCAWLLQGGMHGCSGGACVVAGGCAWFFR